MTTFRLEWKGDALRRRVLQAAQDGIDKTMAEAVNVAKPLTPVRTGILQGSIRFEPAKIQGNKVSGIWGSHDVKYAIWVEIGARGRPGRLMLRRGADAAYPHLAQNIKAAFKR